MVPELCIGVESRPKKGHPGGHRASQVAIAHVQ
jgi:hypothetical protein